MNLSANTRRAVKNYGLLACLTARHMNIVQGEGASTIAFQGPSSVKTTRQADAACNAGEELRAAVLDAYLDTITFDPSLVSSTKEFARATFGNDYELRAAASRRAL